MTIRCMGRYRKRAVLCAWSSKTFGRQAYREKTVEDLGAKRALKMLRTAWQSLHEHAAVHARAQGLAEDLLRARQLQILKCCLRAWQEDTSTRHQRSLVVACQSRRIASRVLRETFGAWGRSYSIASGLSDQYRNTKTRSRVLRAWKILTTVMRQRRLGLRRLAEAHRARRMRWWFARWQLAVRQHLEHMERLKTCIKRKKVRNIFHDHIDWHAALWVVKLLSTACQVAFNHFKNWYWSSFDVEVQVGPHRLFLSDLRDS